MSLNATKSTNTNFLRTISDMQPKINHDSVKKTVQILNKWKKNREECMNILNSILKKHLRIKKDLNKSEIIANVTAIAGASMVVIGLGIAPITFGLSLALTFGGGAVGIAGSLTNASENSEKRAITKKEFKNVQELLNEDKSILLRVQTILKEQNVDKNFLKNNEWLDLNLTRKILEYIPKMIKNVNCVLDMLENLFNILFADENSESDNSENLKKKVKEMEKEIEYILNCIRESVENNSS